MRLAKRDVTICFISDSEMSGLNQKFRKKKGPTDVLSFPSPKREKKFLGDIAIAPETAKRYAKKNGRTLQSELQVLMLHGILHLLGYDHETDNGEMNRIEQKLRRRLGLA